MKHDAWSDTLFLHWKVPSHLEATLQDNCCQPLQRFQDGNCYIGLVLLTEHGVGPILAWIRRLFCVTHHGCNARTYVVEENRAKESTESEGIHFTSLECSSVAASLGARLFGMPYCIADMQRKTVDGIYHFVSRRTGLISYLWKKLKPVLLISRLGLGVQQADHSQFAIDCSWTIDALQGTLQDDALATFLVERYNVYTKKYGLRWKGTVHHEPWKTQRASLKSLSIVNIDAYQPASMRPLIRHLASNSPDSCVFSSGVGPVVFDMLRPV